MPSRLGRAALGGIALNDLLQPFHVGLDVPLDRRSHEAARDLVEALGSTLDSDAGDGPASPSSKEYVTRIGKGLLIERMTIRSPGTTRSNRNACFLSCMGLSLFDPTSCRSLERLHKRRPLTLPTGQRGPIE